MRIVGTSKTVELVLFMLCIFICNGANVRSSGNLKNTRNPSISLNIGILDVPSASTEDSGSSRYPSSSPSEFPDTSNGNGFPGNTRPVRQNHRHSKSDASRGLSLNSFQGHQLDPGGDQNGHHYDEVNDQNRRSDINRQHFSSSSGRQSPEDFRHDRNSNNRGTSNLTPNLGDSIRSPKPNQDIYGGGVLSQSSGRQNHYDSNSQAVRRLGQSGYPGNDEGISSGVDSFNGNVNVGGGRRPQVSGENSGYHSLNANAASQSENGYSSGIDDSFDGNDDGPGREPLQGSNGRRPGSGNGFGGNQDVRRPEISRGYREDADDGGRDENNRKSITNLQGGDGRKPSGGGGGFASGSGGRQRYATERTTTRGYHETSTTRPYRRTTSRPEDVSESGCRLPRQPRAGHYDLGGCDAPCDKEPGDFVPNTSVLTYTCDNGFVRNGSAVSVCLNDSWYMPPSCLRTCPPLESISVDITCKLRDSEVACDVPVAPGTRATLACKHSYKIPLTEDPAYREIRCLEDGVWDRQLFRCLPKCGTTIAHGSTLVVNGFTAKVGVFPWHVGIYEKKSRHVYEQICAGTLINSNLVVSAAHCFYDESINEPKSASKYYAAAGKHYRSWSREEDYSQKTRIKTINIAQRYIGARGNFAQDIALLEVQTPFDLTDLVHPVCLDWDNVLEREHLQVGRYGKAVGWGKTLDGEPSEELQGINVPFVSFDQCVADVPKDFRGYITPDKFCAGYRNGSSLCEGDSGGGLCFESNGLWYLRGIVSVSPVKDHSCDYQSYTGFTYFSHFRDWIRSAFLKT
ncbi:uncharacterized protein LOC107043767 [Diachasma alloeum]|uniref:uncharacterized protein LOC107043767 n=1 Tax=Diachasma alloeum TaxID=454923 RepID=UPI000738259B|nr:uncharacterized protein LOC107043767 [Diachasma alloeum]